jgi:hypothetical protein
MAIARSFRTLGFRAGNARGKRFHRRMREQVRQRSLHPQHLPHPRDHPHRQQRVPAQLEEVVVAAHPLHAEHLGPDPGQRRLGLAHRRRVLPGRIGIPFRGGERLAVQLPVRGERIRLHPHVRRRHHVPRQTVGEMRLQRVHGDRLVPQVVRHQPPVAGRVLADENDRGAHTRVLREPRLDLAQLDPVAAHLHLEVDPAQVLQLPVRAPAHAVHHPVHPAPRRAERAGDEALRRHRGTVRVAARQAVARQVELAPATPGTG